MTRRRLSENIRRTRGDCTTCTATSKNGRRRLDFTSIGAVKNSRKKNRGRPSILFAAEAGKAPPNTAVPPIATTPRRTIWEKIWDSESFSQRSPNNRRRSSLQNRPIGETAATTPLRLRATARLVNLRLPLVGLRLQTLNLFEVSFATQAETREWAAAHNKSAFCANFSAKRIFYPFAENYIRLER